MGSQGRTNFYVLEGGDFNLPGKGWLTYVGDVVEVTGSVSRKGGTAHLRVTTARMVTHALADSERLWEIVPYDPELALKDLSGARRRLSEYRGRVVVLNFFATYCVPCRKELPQLTAIQRKYADKGVQVIAVSADELSDAAKVRRLVRETKLDVPVWLGATEADMARFGLRPMLPDTVIIGRDGRVAERVEGVFNPAELRKQIDALTTQAAKGGSLFTPPSGFGPPRPSAKDSYCP
jgi:thiol-disulfide isomerase/thioredoxin